MARSTGALNLSMDWNGSPSLCRSWIAILPSAGNTSILVSASICSRASGRPLWPSSASSVMTYRRPRGAIDPAIHALIPRRRQTSNATSVVRRSSGERAMSLRVSRTPSSGKSARNGVCCSCPIKTCASVPSNAGSFVVFVKSVTSTVALGGTGDGDDRSPSQYARTTASATARAASVRVEAHIRRTGTSDASDPARTRSVRSWPSSMALWYRSSRLLARARRMTRSSCGGRSVTIWLAGRGSDLRIASHVPRGVGASNGRLPVAASYSTTPRE